MPGMLRLMAGGRCGKVGGTRAHGGMAGWGVSASGRAKCARARTLKGAELLLPLYLSQ